MRRELVTLLSSPCCKAELKLDSREILISTSVEFAHGDIKSGILSCIKCGNEYPIIDGIPRLCTKLWDKEINELRRFKNIAPREICPPPIKGEINIYTEIEKKIRIIKSLPEDASSYAKRRRENDIQYNIRDCEKQKKYVDTLKSYYEVTKVNAVLDVGGGPGGLIKCFSKYYTADFFIMLDYDLSFVDIAKLRNPSVQIVRGDATNLPFKRESIDIVISQAMLEHIKKYDAAIKEMCEVARSVLFISWNPNKFSVYDFGHLDAPVTIFPKKIAICIAILWHKMRKTGKKNENIRSDLEEIFYIATTHVKKMLSKYGHAYNVFADFLLHSIESDYSYNAAGVKSFLKKHPIFTRIICNLLIWLKIEPQSYYILKKGCNE